MVKSTIGNEIGKMTQKGLSSRSPKDKGDPGCSYSKGSKVASTRKSNNRKSGRGK
jgi:hypothetical protein